LPGWFGGAGAGAGADQAQACEEAGDQDVFHVRYR
jgi:hypothetical protein